MKNLIFAVVFLFITSAFVTIQTVKTKESNIKVEKNSTMPKKEKRKPTKWQSTATLTVQHTDKGTREIEGFAGCATDGGKGGYDYQKDAEKAARQKALSKMKSDEKEISCSYASFLNCDEQ